jgi:hypothetical protein
MTPIGAWRELYFLFTYFDQVAGDNLPTFSVREEHVLASAENVLKYRFLKDIASLVGEVAEELDLILE